MVALIIQSTFWTLLFLLINPCKILASLTSDPVPQPQTILDPDAVNILTQESTLTLLNKLRKRHGVPPLEHDVVLGQSAAKWVKRVHDKVILLGSLVPLYSHPHIEGENVWVSPGSGSKPEDAIHSWYCEGTNFDFVRNEFKFKTAQFSQLVWKRTRRLGIAGLVDPLRNFTVIVARFKPPGNVGFSLSFKENIFPALKDIQLLQSEFPSCPEELGPLDTPTLVEEEIKIKSDQNPRKNTSSDETRKENNPENKSLIPIRSKGQSLPQPLSNVHSQDDSPFAKGPLEQVETTQSKRQQSLAAKEQIVGNKTKIVALEKIQDKNIPQKISAVKVPNGSSEAYAVHRLDDATHAKGVADAQEIHRAKLNKTTSKT